MVRNKVYINFESLTFFQFDKKASLHPEIPASITCSTGTTAVDVGASK